MRAAGDVVDVLDERPVAERRPQLHAVRHAHAVGAVEVGGRPAGQGEVGDLARPALLGGVALDVRDLGEGVAVVLVGVAEEVELLAQLPVDHGGAQAARRGVVAAFEVDPREGLRVAVLGVVGPEVAVEDLVGGLAGEHGGEARLAQPGEELDERDVHVAERGRGVLAAQGRGVHLGVGEGGRVEEDLAVLRADVLRGERRVGGVGRGAHRGVRLEVLGVAGEVHREALQRAAMRRR